MSVFRWRECSGTYYTDPEPRQAAVAMFGVRVHSMADGGLIEAWVEGRCGDKTWATVALLSPIVEPGEHFIDVSDVPRTWRMALRPSIAASVIDRNARVAWHRPDASQEPQPPGETS